MINFYLTIEVNQNVVELTIVSVNTEFLCILFANVKEQFVNLLFS